MVYLVVLGYGVVPLECGIHGLWLLSQRGCSTCVFLVNLVLVVVDVRVRSIPIVPAWSSPYLVCDDEIAQVQSPNWAGRLDRADPTFSADSRGQLA